MNFNLLIFIDFLYIAKQFFTWSFKFQYMYKFYLFTYFYRFFCTLQNSDLHGPLNFNTCISFGINIIRSGFIAFCFA